jgi:putative ABC transport system permease protein
VDQIGIMKAIGARTWQIVRLYLTIILFYSLLALSVALPIGILGARAISSWLVGSFGATIGGFEIDQTSVIVMIAVVLLSPLLASLVPIFSGARTTVREAISTYGLSTRTGLLERMLAKMRSISRLVLVTISNAFRHKGRVVLLQISLVMSGLMFMMVVSVRDSVSYTIRDVLFSILSADVTYVLDRNYRIEQVEQITRAYPGIQSVEMWVLANGSIRLRDQPETEDDESVLVFGVPLPTHLYGYQLRAGRWLLPEDTSAVVLNQRLAQDLGAGVGDWITIRYTDRRQSNWQVVGLIFDPVLTNSAHVSRPLMQRDLGLVGKASTVWIQTVTSDPSSQIEFGKNMRAYYERSHIEVSPQRGVFGIGGDATVETGNAFIGQFEFLVILLGLMALIIGIVGSIALSGALSLSVMERRREIGVMRAIGASSWTIFRMFIGEGILLGWLSWLIALPLSLPAGRLMVQTLGAAFNLDIVYQFTPTGPILWLGIITILSILASGLPARGATRISVRESLAYQ